MSSVGAQPDVLDDARYIPLLVLSAISGTLSILGSGSVIYMTSRNLSTKLMDRLVFSLSVSDMFSSISSVLMPYLIPPYIGLAGASGSHASCSAIGFVFMSFVMMGCCYNSYLSIYYLLVVRRSWKEHDFQKPLEITAHSFAVVVPFSVNVAAAATQSINPSPLVNNLCLYATWPWMCNENDDIDCQRSSRHIVNPIAGAACMFVLVFSFLAFLSTFLVWLKVRSTLKRSSAYRFQGDKDPASDDRMRQTCIQAILYSAAYFNTLVWPAVCLILSNEHVNTGEEIEEKKNQPGFYTLKVLFSALYPLQGFLNFFIYTRLRVKRWRSAEPERSLFWVYKQVIFASSSPHNQSTLPRSAGRAETIKSHRQTHTVAGCDDSFTNNGER